MKMNPKSGWRAWALALAIVLVLAIALLAVGCGSTSTTTTGGATTTAGVTSTSNSTITSAASSSTTKAGTTDLVLASTTSTKDSGLFDVLIPAFTKAYPQYNVKVVAVGSGQALTLGQNGDADVLLVHSPAAELTFMAGGYGIDRKAVMYKDFIVVGPASDPAKVKGLTSATEAFAKIAAAKALFYTRGDASGTNAAELVLWKAANITPSGSWYVKTGQGMGQTLTIADQKSGYTLADRATYLANKASLKLAILVEGDKALFNQYHVITCKKAKNIQGANDFMNWIVSADVQQNVIATYGVTKYGQQLFIPNAGKVQ